MLFTESPRIRLRRRTQDVERLRLRSRVNELFTQSRSAAGSRSIVSLVQEDGEQMGRFKVRGLMRELDLVSKQSGSHVYKHAMVERGHQGVGHGLRTVWQASRATVSLGSGLARRIQPVVATLD